MAPLTRPELINPIVRSFWNCDISRRGEVGLARTTTRRKIVHP